MRRPVNLRHWKLAAPLLVVAASACVRTVDLGTVEVAQDIRHGTTVRSAQNLPSRFTVVTPPAVTGDCPVRLRDDIVGTTLSLSRSMLLPVQDTTGDQQFQSFGDYAVTPRGQYGDTEPGDGLRIDCIRLRALGIITLGAPTG
ncbi:hypothetical protein BH23GEM9_BH23GEM9_21930 [soil metagenome]